MASPYSVLVDAGIPASVAVLLPICIAVNVEVVANGCWLWTGRVDPEGYGRAGRNGRNRRALTPSMTT